MDSEFCTVKEMAVIFEVHPNTIYKAIKRGFIIAVRTGDGKRSSYRISKKSINQIHKSIIFEYAQMVKKSDQM